MTISLYRKPYYLYFRIGVLAPVTCMAFGATIVLAVNSWTCRIIHPLFLLHLCILATGILLIVRCVRRRNDSITFDEEGITLVLHSFILGSISERFYSWDQVKQCTLEHMVAVWGHIYHLEIASHNDIQPQRIPVTSFSGLEWLPDVLTRENYILTEAREKDDDSTGTYCIRLGAFLTFVSICLSAPIQYYHKLMEGRPILVELTTRVTTRIVPVFHSKELTDYYGNKHTIRTQWGKKYLYNPTNVPVVYFQVLYGKDDGRELAIDSVHMGEHIEIENINWRGTPPYSINTASYQNEHEGASNRQRATIGKAFNTVVLGVIHYEGRNNIYSKDVSRTNLAYNKGLPEHIISITRSPYRTNLLKADDASAKEYEQMLRVIGCDSCKKKYH